MDEVVALGWAHVEKHAYQTFLTEAEEAPDALKGPLQLLAQLYGLTRLEGSMAHYLADGVLKGRFLPSFEVQPVLPKWPQRHDLARSHGFRC